MEVKLKDLQEKNEEFVNLFTDGIHDPALMQEKLVEYATFSMKYNEFIIKEAIKKETLLERATEAFVGWVVGEDVVLPMGNLEMELWSNQGVDVLTAVTEEKERVKGLRKGKA